MPWVKNLYNIYNRVLSDKMKHACTWLFFLPILLSSCCKSCLTVQTDYLTHKNLASYYVGTPDPRQNIAAVGQRLIICWSVPKEYLSYENLRLEVKIRFRNREEIIEIFHIQKTRGTYVFALFNADYFTKKGILTYKIDLIGSDYILEEWRHKIWVDLIAINQDENICKAEKQEKDEGLQDEDDYPIDWTDEDPF